MKNAPKVIYLQVCDEDDCGSSFYEHEGVTWCQDMINDSDIKYVRADLAKQEWVGLTDKQKLSLEIQGNKSDVLLAELVEQWLRGNNNA